MYGWSKVEINNLIKQLKNDDIALHKEGTTEGYLGIDIQKDGQHITLKTRRINNENN